MKEGSYVLVAACRRTLERLGGDGDKDGEKLLGELGEDVIILAESVGLMCQT